MNLPRKRAIDRFYRRKDIPALLKELFSYASLSKEGILGPSLNSHEAAESYFTAEYILVKLNSLPGGKEALKDLQKKFKKGEVDEKGRTPEEAKKEEEAYERRMREQGMFKLPDGGGWTNQNPNKSKKTKKK